MIRTVYAGGEVMDYDLVVVGAGIQGAGVAQAAAAAGYRVLVLERDAVAAGTSSRSSKLIHGGLRYLETAQFSLVRESLRERALLLRLAPELVRLEWLYLPVYNGGQRGTFTIATGLSLYALLAGLDRDARFARIPRRQWAELDGLRETGLRQVFRYREAQTDDRALTSAVLRSALALGAELAMPAQFVAAQRHEQGCEVRYREGYRELSVSCRVLVNCAGPWATGVLKGITPALPQPAVELVQGAHLLLPPLLQHHYYLESPVDRRGVFALPWRGRLLLGTTETPHRGEPETSRCLDSERDYLLATLTHYFPGLTIPEHQVDSFAGLRVLPRSEQGAFHRSREVLYTVDDPHRPRVLSVMGGKLTTYRATAQSVMARLSPSLPAATPRADTAKLPLDPQ